MSNTLQQDLDDSIERRLVLGQKIKDYMNDPDTTDYAFGRDLGRQFGELSTEIYELEDKLTKQQEEEDNE